MTGPLDLRLLPIAIGLWVGSAVGLHLPLGLPTAMACLLPLLMMRVRRPGIPALALSLMLGVLLASLRVDAAAPQAVEDALRQAGAVRFSAVVNAEPRAVERRGFGGLQVQQVTQAAITITRMEWKRAAWQVSVPATLEWERATGVVAVGSTVGGVAVLHRDDPARRSVYRIRLRGALEVQAAPSRGSHLAQVARRGLATAAARHGSGDGAALLPGLVLGDTRAQSSSLVEALRVSGLAHLTAVSGANVAIVTAAILWLLRRTRLRPTTRTALLGLTLVAFVIVVQPQPSVVRAAVMGGLGLVALLTGERRTGASVLWLAVVLLLIVDPFLAWQYGFLLSVAATAGLIVFRPFLQRSLLRGRTGLLADAVLVTVSAQLATFPVLLLMGRPPTWLSVPANLLCEPLVAPATVSGFAAALLAMGGSLPVLGALFAEAAAVVALPGVWLAGIIAAVAARGAASPLAVAPIASFGALLAVLAVALLLRRLRVPRMVMGVAAVFVLVLSCAPPRGWPPPDWWIASCDVGQGDATVVRVAKQEAVLIDAGPDPAAIRTCLQRLHISHVSLLLLTHFHADHVEGLPGALAVAGVEVAYGTCLHEPAVEFRRVSTWLGAPPADLQAGDVIRIGSTVLRVLWPQCDDLAGDPNNASVVVDVEQAGRHALITGDADAAAQQALRLPSSAYAWLKVAHHGSRYQDDSFVERVSPAVAVVSVGAGNDYGHPAMHTLAALQRLHVPVYRTDENGGVALVRRPEGLAVATERR